MFWFVYSEPMLSASQTLTCYIFFPSICPNTWVFTSYCVGLLSQELMESIPSMDKATQLTSYNKLTVHCSHLISKDHRITALPRYFQKLNFSHVSIATAILTIFSIQVCTWISFQLAKSRRKQNCIQWKANGKKKVIESSLLSPSQH